MNNRDYLPGVPAERFAQIIPNRRRVIESASVEMPRYEYNANVLVKKLHPQVQYVVVSEIRELPGAKLYTLKADKEKGTESLAYFSAGQYISLQLQIGDSLLTRPYSLCGSPAQALKGEYQIVVKNMKDGFASSYINEHYTIGTKIDISAPLGFFRYEPLRDTKRVIGIAGGSGIAPFMSMAKAIAEGTEDFELTLLYGSRREEEILFKKELDELQSSCEKIRVVHVLSDEEKESYRHGFISAELISEYLDEDNTIFVCGSQGMYDFIRKEAQKLNVPLKRLRFDAYGQYKLTNRDEEFLNGHKGKVYELTVITDDGVSHRIEANAEEPVLVAIERAGIKAPSHCRSGECGWCRLKLVTGEIYAPEMTERRRQYDKVAGYIHACASFPCSNCTVMINCEGRLPEGNG